MPGIIGERMVGSNDMRLIEAMDEKAALVIDGEAEGTARDPHSMVPEELFGFAEQSREHRTVIDSLDKSEESACIVELADVPAVDRGVGASARLAVQQSDERLDDMLAHERGAARIEDHANFGVDGLDPPRVPGLRASRRGNERLDSPFVDDGNNLQVIHSARVRASGRGG